MSHIWLHQRHKMKIKLFFRLENCFRVLRLADLQPSSINDPKRTSVLTNELQLKHVLVRGTQPDEAALKPVSDVITHKRSWQQAPELAALKGVETAWKGSWR